MSYPRRNGWVQRHTHDIKVLVQCSLVCGVVWILSLMIDMSLDIVDSSYGSQPGPWHRQNTDYYSLPDFTLISGIIAFLVRYMHGFHVSTHFFLVFLSRSHVYYQKRQTRSTAFRISSLSFLSFCLQNVRFLNARVIVKPGWFWMKKLSNDVWFG